MSGMKSLIYFFVALIPIGVMWWWTYKSVKKTNSLSNKISDITIVLVITSVYVIYLLDTFNIPTVLGLSKNVNIDNWFSFVGNYLTGIITSIIGALIAVWTTLYQIRNNNEETEKRDKENARLQNLPLLKYAINTNKNVEANLENFIMTNEEVDKTEKVYRFSLSVKNIGLNNIKRLKVKLESEIFSKHARNIFGYDSIEMLEKDEEVIINKYFNLKEENVPYEMLITVFYEDVLSNWYKQTLKVEYIATNKFEVGGYIGEVKYLVNEEEIIDVKEVD